jgi:threonine/homoserine/homoserine lactone efflux protein
MIDPQMIGPQMIDPLYVFVFLGLFSPGPNVIMLTTSGARFGFRRSLPHVLGVVIGVGCVAAATAIGLRAILTALPWLEFALGLVAVGWIAWMAHKLWHAAPPAQSGGGDVSDRPFTFTEAVVFQAINPKIWAVAISAISAYGSDWPLWAETTRMATAFSGINLFVCLFWSFAGSLLVNLIATETTWRIFTRIMAVGLLMAGIMVFL